MFFPGRRGEIKQDNRYNSHAAWEYLRRQNYLHVMLDTGREFVGSAPWTSGISAVQQFGGTLAVGRVEDFRAFPWIFVDMNS